MDQKKYNNELRQEEEKVILVCLLYDSKVTVERIIMLLMTTDG